MDDPGDNWGAIEPDYVGYLAGFSTLFRPPTLAESGGVNAAQRNLGIATTILVLLLLLEIGNGWGPWARTPTTEGVDANAIPGASSPELTPA